MSTTTIRLPDEALGRAFARVTAHSKQTAHSFILEAIAEKAAQEEQRKDFQDVAEQRYANIVASGKTIDHDTADMRSYLEDKLRREERAKRPQAKKLARWSDVAPSSWRPKSPKTSFWSAFTVTNTSRNTKSKTSPRAYRKSFRQSLFSNRTR